MSLSSTTSSRRTLIAGSVPYAPFPQHLGSFKEQLKVIGPASTLKLVAKNSITSPLPESGPGAIPKGQHWVDLTDEGTVVVIEQPEGQSCAAIGGIMALRMKTRGAMGCVVGGRVRDLEELNNCGLPVSAPGTVNRIWKPKASAPVLVGHAPSMPGQVCLRSSLYPVWFFLFDLLDISSLFADLSALSERAKRDMYWHHPPGEKDFSGVESSRQGFPE